MVRFYFAVLIRHILRLSTVEIQPIKPKAKMKKKNKTPKSHLGLPQSIDDSKSRDCRR